MQPPAIPPTDTLQDLVAALPPEDRWSVEQLVCEDEGYGLAQVLEAGHLRGVSDGSFKEGRGTSSFGLCRRVLCNIALNSEYY